MPTGKTECWLFVQSTGLLYRPDGSYCSAGYSGHGDGVDNPALQDVKNVGPIPVGLYTLGEVTQEKGPFTIRLVPDPGNDMAGRSGLLVHGDNREVNHTASEGCIVLPRLARIELAQGGTLRVIATPAKPEMVT